jgi:hypothetical protein
MSEVIEEKRIEENIIEEKKIKRKDTGNKLTYELGLGWLNYQKFIEKAEIDFPYVDIYKEFDKASAWIKENPSQRMKADYNRFMLNWIKRADEKTPKFDDIFAGAI